MQEDLFTINLTAPGVSRLSELGLLRKSGSIIKSRLEKKVNDLTLTALRAFQDSVPVDTGSLRDDHIDFDFEGSIASGTYSGRVFVDDNSHTGKRGQTLTASDLARALNENKWKRSLNRSKLTQNWIEEGREAFLQEYKVQLNG